MSSRERPSVWVSTRGGVLAFLPKEKTPKVERPKRPRPTPPSPPRQPTAEEVARAAHEEEIRTLDYEIELTKRQFEVAQWKARTKHAESGTLEDTPPGASLPEKHAEKIELRLTELEAAYKYGAEKITRLRREASRIFLNVHMLKGEKRARLRALLDVYGVDAGALPPAIREVLEEDDEYESPEA